MTINLHFEEFEILRGVVSGCLEPPRILDRKPVKVATVRDEAGLLADRELVHNKNCFLEDKFSDWTFDEKTGKFRYFSRVAEKADVIVVYLMTPEAKVEAGAQPQKAKRPSP